MFILISDGGTKVTPFLSSANMSHNVDMLYGAQDESVCVISRIETNSVENYSRSVRDNAMLYDTIHGPLVDVSFAAYAEPVYVLFEGSREKVSELNFKQLRMNAIANHKKNKSNCL